jgi:hypothetical protein
MVLIRGSRYRATAALLPSRLSTIRLQAILPHPQWVQGTRNVASCIAASVSCNCGGLSCLVSTVAIARDLFPASFDGESFRSCLAFCTSKRV